MKKIHINGKVCLKHQFTGSKRAQSRLTSLAAKLWIFLQIVILMSITMSVRKRLLLLDGKGQLNKGRVIQMALANIDSMPQKPLSVTTGNTFDHHQL